MNPFLCLLENICPKELHWKADGKNDHKMSEYNLCDLRYEQKSNADPHILKDIVEAGLEYNDGVPPRS